MKNKTRMFVAVMFMLISISSCAGTGQFAYHDNTENMEGPGLFTGEEGELTYEIKRGNK